MMSPLTTQVESAKEGTGPAADARTRERVNRRSRSQGIERHRAYARRAPSATARARKRACPLSGGQHFPFVLCASVASRCLTLALPGEQACTVKDRWFVSGYLRDTR